MAEHEYRHHLDSASSGQSKIWTAHHLDRADKSGSAVTPTLTPIATRDDAQIHTHRCDRCGARAKVRVVLAGGMDLAFCGHHAREYDDKLRGVAVDFVDLDASESPAPAGESLN